MGKENEEPKQVRPCRKCGSTDITPGNIRAENWFCRACKAAQQALWYQMNRERVLAQKASWRRANTEKVRVGQHGYFKSLPGIAARLRVKHGLILEESILWASLLLDPSTRCICCGIPNRIIMYLNEHGPWPRVLGKRSGSGACRRLQLGHVIPADNSGGFIPMCSACNNHLRARVFNAETGASVLRWIRKRWLDPKYGKPEKKLWWLNKSVDESGCGVGGRSYRNEKFEEKRQARWAKVREAEDGTASSGGPAGRTGPSGDAQQTLPWDGELVVEAVGAGVQDRQD